VLHRNIYILITLFCSKNKWPASCLMTSKAAEFVTRFNQSSKDSFSGSSGLLKRLIESSTIFVIFFYFQFLSLTGKVHAGCCYQVLYCSWACHSINSTKTTFQNPYRQTPGIITWGQCNLILCCVLQMLRRM